MKQQITFDSAGVVPRLYAEALKQYMSYSTYCKIVREARALKTPELRLSDTDMYRVRHAIIACGQQDFLQSDSFQSFILCVLRSSYPADAPGINWTTSEGLDTQSRLNNVFRYHGWRRTMEDTNKKPGYNYINYVRCTQVTINDREFDIANVCRFMMSDPLYIRMLVTPVDYPRQASRIADFIADVIMAAIWVDRVCLQNHKKALELS